MTFLKQFQNSASFISRKSIQLCMKRIINVNIRLFGSGTLSFARKMNLPKLLLLHSLVNRINITRSVLNIISFWMDPPTTDTERKRLYLHNWSLQPFRQNYDLASHTTYTVCFMAILFTFRVFARNLLIDSRWRNIFIFSFWCLNCLNVWSRDYI